MSYVAPVIAVLDMMCTARAATSAGPTTRPMGSVARSSSRRLSRSSPSSEAERGVSTKPGAMRFTRTGAISRGAPADHHVVDRAWEALEERLQRGRVAGVERRRAQRAELARRVLQPLWVAAGQDHVGSLGPHSPCRL